jgi:hypothetical protein
MVQEYEEIKELSEDISKTIITKLQKQGYLEKFKIHDPLLESLPLSQITGASIQHMIAFGQNAPYPVRRILQDPHEGQRSSDKCYSSSGFSLHATTVIPFWNRKRLFNLCSYISRPPLSKHSLEELPIKTPQFAPARGSPQYNLFEEFNGVKNKYYISNPFKSTFT